MFSADATPEDIFQTRLFEEPLVPVGAEPTPAENAALADALLGYSKRHGPDDFSGLTGFLETHPESPWNAALLTNLGLEYYNAGHYSKALDAWTRAWELARVSVTPKGKAVAERAVGELAYMHARLGRMTERYALLSSIEGRTFSGPATERITGAREGLSNMQDRPEIAFRCGPLALQGIKLFVDPQNPGSELIHAAASTQKGFSLPQVEELSQKLGLNFQMAFREKGAALVVPSVVHLKVNHYAAMIRQEGDRYLLQDPTFGNDVWVTREALETETSGYFLIPPGDLAYGWRAVGAQEGETVWGKGNTGGNEPGPHGPCDPQSSGGSPCKSGEDCCAGMAVPRVHLMLVSLNIKDEPVGYSPPVGPSVRFVVRYNQRDAFQPSNFTYSNFGPKWTFDWLSYITDNPFSPSADVNYYIMGGGTRTFTGFDNATQTYALQQFDQTKLVRTSPDSYEMLSRDGARKVFSRPNGSIGTSRKIFLTRLIDPFGNAVSLTYDANLRVVAITDAIGQVTTISYEHPTDVFKITKVTDPFGRSAAFDYDASNRLIKITDVIGITSQFTYDAGDFITSLTTPYGVTSFAKSESGTTRSLETVYPDGNRERVEYNQSPGPSIPSSDSPQSVPAGMATRNEFLFFRNTFYWDRMAYASAAGDYTKAKIYHWLHTTNIALTAGILESVKEPLEGRVWYDYAGQPVSEFSSLVVGSSNQPTHIGRVLDDGSTQLYTYEYNGFGNVTKMIDPSGRTFSYVYAANGIDLLEVRQTRAGQSHLLSKGSYNTQHLPLTSEDAAGQTTAYTYNTRGQLLTRTNPKGETITHTYDSKGFLTKIDRGLPGGGDSITFTYDAFGRVRTVTDLDGDTISIDYDALDRPTRITHPDGSFEQLTYNRLDEVARRDRAGRLTTYEFNAVRQMVKKTDPLNRSTLFQWCKCGDVKRVTDPMGRTTSWRHDVQGRVTGKEYADGSRVSYLYEKATSRVRQRIDEKSQVTQYNYNRDDTVSAVSHPNAVVPTSPVRYTYDPNYRRLASMQDATGTTRYTYNPISPTPGLGAGRLAAIAGPLPNLIINFAYDELGRVDSRAINGVASTKAFDAAGRVTGETNALGTFSYGYDGSARRLLSASYPNGQKTSYRYLDNLGDRQLARIIHTQGAQPVSEFTYQYDVPAARVTAWVQQSGARAPLTHSFTYDASDRLLTANVADGAAPVKNCAYTYDPADNRLTERIDNTTTESSYNALNELTATDGDSPSAAVYEWDAGNRLAAVNQGDKRTECTYDGRGRLSRIRNLLNGVEVSDRRFVWCGNEMCEERGADGAVVKRFYNRGVRVEKGEARGNFFYTQDHLGSVRELTDGAGSVVASFVYDPYGRRSQLSGTAQPDFGFAGLFFENTTALCMTLFRVYDPSRGRWLSRDPLVRAELSQGTNLYAYVDNNPINLIDPHGLQQVMPKAPPPAPGTPEPERCIDVLDTVRGAAACIGCVFEIVVAVETRGPDWNSIGTLFRTGGGNFCAICVKPGIPYTDCPPEPAPADPWGRCVSDELGDAPPPCAPAPNMCVGPGGPQPPKPVCGGD